MEFNLDLIRQEQNTISAGVLTNTYLMFTLWRYLGDLHPDGCI